MVVITDVSAFLSRLGNFIHRSTKTVPEEYTPIQTIHNRIPQSKQFRFFAKTMEEIRVSLDIL